MRRLPIVVAVVLTVCSAATAFGAPTQDVSRSVAHYIMGLHWEMEGDAARAALAYERAAAADRTAAVICLRLGVNDIRLGRYRAAVRALEQAVRLDPADMQAHYFLALVYSHLRLYDQASAEYELIVSRAAGASPQNAGILMYLAQLYAARGDEAGAVAVLEKVLVVDPDNTDVMALLGGIFLEGPRRIEGKQLLGRCVAVDPHQVDCLNALAYSNAEDNVHLPESFDMVESALADDPRNPAYLDTRAWVLYRLGRHEEALRDLLAADAELKDPEILEHLETVYRALGQQERAASVRTELEGLRHQKDVSAVPAERREEGGR